MGRAALTAALLLMEIKFIEESELEKRFGDIHPRNIKKKYLLCFLNMA